MVELEAVTKRYGRRGAAPDALHEVTLALAAGQTTAIVGPNGAGKSTLLGLVLGFLRPTSGDVAIAGLAPREYLRDRGAGYLPERFALPPQLTVAGALRLFGRLDGGQVDRDGAIERLGLADFLDKRAGELSRGMLQRVGVAQALLARHELVVLDEPTEGLDPLWRIRLRDVIAALQAAGTTVVLASHDLGEVERVARQVVVLEGGRVKQVLQVDAPQAAAWRVRLDAPFDRFDVAFPVADRAADGSWTVRVSGPVELSERLGALIALGGVVSAVEPARVALEERVRQTLEEAP
jgi:ABC-type multidrug transport system ATPase subunit